MTPHDHDIDCARMLSPDPTAPCTCKKEEPPKVNRQLLIFAVLISLLGVASDFCQGSQGKPWP